jgi:formate hydrogenlyase subunit 4
MSAILSLLAQIFHIGLMTAAAPSLAGLMGWLDARISGRSGPPVVQPWRDLLRLSRKTPLLQESVSVVSRIAPAVGLGAMLVAVMLVPSFTLGMALAPLSDVLVVTSLMTLARVACGLVALDSGAALPGLSAQGSSARAVLAEPALMLAVFSLAPASGSFNLDTIIGQQREGIPLPTAAAAVTLCALLILLFADAGSVDRGHDDMLSGSDLAVMRMTGWIRRLIWVDLIGGLFLPVGMAAADSDPSTWLIGLVCWVVKVVAFVLVLSLGMAMLGRMPRQGLLQIKGIAGLLALLATIMVFAAAGLE